jgi:small subunit ribosomal protein S10
MSQKIRIKLKSYDHMLVDKSAEKIVKTVKSTGAVVTDLFRYQLTKNFYSTTFSTR